MVIYITCLRPRPPRQLRTRPFLSVAAPREVTPAPILTAALREVGASGSGTFLDTSVCVTLGLTGRTVSSVSVGDSNYIY